MGVAMVAFLAFPLGAFLVSHSINRYSSAPLKDTVRLCISKRGELDRVFVCLTPVFSHHAPSRSDCGTQPDCVVSRLAPDGNAMGWARFGCFESGRYRAKRMSSK